MERKLAAIEAGKKKILINILIRSIWFVLAGMSCIFNKSINEKAEIAMMVILVLLLIFALFPLVHLKDTLVFYDNKIVLGKKQITFSSPEEIQWKREHTYIMGTRIKIYNLKAAEKETFLQSMFSSKDMDVTYMEDAKDTFIKCYMNQ